MGKRLLTLAFIIYSLLAAGQQNLVPNPSFEEHTTCPTANCCQIDLAIPWFQPIVSGSTSDLFDECSSNTNTSVPSNVFGVQYARNGKAYSGIGVWGDDLLTREYIEVKLTNPLKAKKKYCVQFYVSLAESCNYGVANVGAYFSQDSILYNPPVGASLLSYTPQVSNSGSPIISKENWILISEEFVASGGEQFMTIGNFYSDANTTKQHTGDSSNIDYTYYYIDDVSVICCDESGCDGLDDLPNVFTPNGDGLNDVFSIDASAFESISCEIYNRWGIKVASLSEGNSSWDGRTTSGQEALEGVYYYVVRARDEKGKEISRTGFVQLLR